MAPPTSQEALYQEGRIDLAKHAYQLGSFKSVSAAATAYDVPRKTLSDRLKGKKPKRGSILKNRILTTTEEEHLLQWILSIDRRGILPPLSTVRDMVSLLAS
jgi:hypothetical protein